MCSIHPLTAAAGFGPAPPVSKTGVLTFTPSRRDNGEGRTHDHGVAVRCLGLLATLSCTPVGTRIRISALGEPGAFLLHYRSIASVEGLEPSPCGFRGPVPCPVWRYGQISVVGFEPTASSFGGKRSHPSELYRQHCREDSNLQYRIRSAAVYPLTDGSMG